MVVVLIVVLIVVLVVVFPSGWLFGSHLALPWPQLQSPCDVVPVCVLHFPSTLSTDVPLRVVISPLLHAYPHTCIIV